MITKVICDRCGKEIEEPKSEHLTFSEATSPTVMCHFGSYSADTDTYIDLCSECVEEFHKWMKSGKDGLDLNKDLEPELTIPE